MSVWSNEQIVALRAAMAAGVRRVTVGTQTTEYQSLQDMQAVLDRMLAENASAPTEETPGPKCFSRQHIFVR